MLLAEFSIWPMDKGESVGAYVARCLDIVDRSGLPYKLGPLGTCIEGEWDEVMAVIKRAVDTVAAGSSRVSLVLKADIRPGHTSMLTAKVERVEEALGG